MVRKIILKLCKMPYYAVARGRKTGVFKTWTECESQVKGFQGAVFKKFPTDTEAKLFILGKIAPSSETGDKTNKVSSTTKGGKKVKTASDAIKTAEHTKTVTRQRYGQHEFQEDSDGYVHVYTDGSCENNGKVNAIAGFGVYFDENHPLNVSAPVVGPATNNRGEIQAATKAIAVAAEHGIRKLCINADSKFVMQSVTEWISGWKKRDWKLSSGGPVKNETDFKKLDAVMTQHSSVDIRWNYVPAHTGIHGNERADELAKLGGKSYKKDIALAPVRYAPYTKK